MATPAENLASAQLAYHRLMTGGAPSVIVDRDGQRVEYHRADTAKLAQYIATLQASIAPVCARPLGVIF